MSLHPAINGTEQRLDLILQTLQRIEQHLAPAPAAPAAPASPPPDGEAKAVDLREPKARRQGGRA